MDNTTFFTLVEERIAAGERVRITLVGTSMQPTLCEGDVLTLAPLQQPPSVGDVVLFRYTGRHILHRIVAIDGDRYSTRGDNCTSSETCHRHDIVAILVDVEKHHPLKHMAVRWLGPKGRRQLRPWYFASLAFLMWAPLNGVGIPLDNYILGLRADHLIHASVFLPCALFLCGSSTRSRQVTSPWLIWLASVGIGLLTEGVQWLLPYRGFDINDLVANVIGVTLGFAAIMLYRQISRRRKQQAH